MSGELFDDYCQRRWGGSQWTKHLFQEGKKDGCQFSNWKYICNTIRAHQFILYGTKYHHETCTTDTMNAALFEALYEEGMNISQVDTLVSIGSKLFATTSKSQNDMTFDAEHLRTYLQQDQGRIEVEEEIKKLQQMYRVRGVPSIHIGIIETAENAMQQEESQMDTKWKTPPIALSGAQPAEVFVEIFQELLTEL